MPEKDMKFCRKSFNNFKVRRASHLPIFYLAHEPKLYRRRPSQLRLRKLGKLIFCDNSISKSIRHSDTAEIATENKLVPVGIKISGL